MSLSCASQEKIYTERASAPSIMSMVFWMP
jgi:hypothetical protein